MLVIKGSPGLHKIVVLNPKGGSGKTTLAFNLAGYLAATGRNTAIIDMDRQGSSMRWLRNRSSDLPGIIGIPAEVSYRDANENQCIVVPQGIDHVVVDAPAGLPDDQLIDYTFGAHAIFVPVLSSDMDIHAASRLISNLLLKAQVSRRNQRLCVVPNRVRERTVAYQRLCRFLDSLSIAVVSTVRDSQNYVWAAEHGTCIHDMPASRVRKDREYWEPISQWLERRLATPLNSRDLLRPREAAHNRRRKRLQSAPFASLAAAIGLIAVSVGLVLPAGDTTVTPNRFPTLPPASEPASQNLIAQVAPPQQGSEISNALERRWRLNGTLNWGDSGLLIVRDRATNASVVVGNNRDLNGWNVSEIGTDYAVFSRGGEEVRLDLGYE